MRYLGCIVVLLISGALALAQDTRGNISGTVTDAQGAVISGATVVVTNTGAGTSTRLTTNSSGYYEAPFCCQERTASASKAPASNVPSVPT